MFFVDRVQEMSVLQTAYEKPESSLFVLYGRRRVGKTTLLSEFCKEKPSLYYLATEESIQANRNAFRLMAADFLQNDLLKSATDASWEMIFSVLLSAQENKKLVIVLDEFQYLGKADKAFPSVFQKIWDTILKNKNVEVILCGSLVHMMVEQTLSYSSPLYGRRFHTLITTDSSLILMNRPAFYIMLSQAVFRSISNYFIHVPILIPPFCKM